MFRFLIVEDDEDLLEELGKAFARWFPDSKIATAFAVDNALQLIEDARSAGWAYDAAILDMKLPKQRGLGDEVDDALCCRIREIMNGTLVIHITGHVRDQKVLENLTSFHQHPSDPRSILIDKNDVRWMENVKKTAKAYLYGAIIEDRMNALFGTDQHGVSPESRTTSRGRLNNRISITMGLADLFREISAHWDALDEKLQNRILRTFNVDTTCKPIRISMLR